ncbi:hypothetical protein PSN45_004957 [Yamadazyma tenuis]|uniref:CoA-binding domain-containing protein n=1 Tax=Candida tenuis (strain ATCC 10573 / BCRC 21748 / CBS 615 / JCM 9827 / NBRC 10315 / NRRL Y-1498 / VKM Y-70) TaxID=590646 RepID=G3B299_CANTC|nr:uncharacterized protein CANTEDRAFT_120384 [Yamadazyma tenuis ATCC 10573]EGV64627.1 hypothetical protein CANTEDRAFT_120384 [Yamadazyma tenuis ATCC 10573]WEJ97406.1 hypothetical protein PSN45_004957 [Yamadazyma tenuis]
MSMKTKIKQFFGASRQYAVSGASNDPSKFGFKITRWYVSHNLPVIPVNPKASEILNQSVVHSISEIVDAIKSKTDIGEHALSGADGLSISFLTPPKITTSTLKQIAIVDGYKGIIKGLWFQPGSYDAEVLEVAQQIGLFDTVVYEDECILVRGEEGLYSANL